MTNSDQMQTLEPVHAGGDEAKARRWSHWLRIFLRAMAAVSLCKGLYHCAIVCGINSPAPSGFDSYQTSYQIATVLFAIIDLVAGVGLWLAAAWGTVVWLTSVIGMAATQIVFPDIYGGSILVIGLELILVGSYVFLTFMAAREQPE